MNQKKPSNYKHSVICYICICESTDVYRIFDTTNLYDNYIHSNIQRYIKIPQASKYLGIESQVILTAHVQFQYLSNYKVQKIVFVLSDIGT